MKQCLYEVLGVDRDASTADIKAAFYRQSRLWHPDKAQQNGISYEEATERSQAINGAWEVLGNPDERKLYDSHRSEILSSPEELSEFDLNLWPYFSPSVFSGYGDTGNGFYAVYAAAFSRISAQEEVFDRRYGSGRSVRAAPRFGGSNSSYADVSAFYGYWSGFKTVKDYSWCEEYDVSEAPNRKVRRLMEEENRKVRKKEQRDFNDAVRQLAAFVKKRDKRVLEHQVELQRLAKEKERKNLARREQEAMERMRKVEMYEEQEWSKVVEEDDSVWDEEEKKEERQEFYCVICEKNFRSEKQWQNHEKSRKHAERAAALKETLLEEDEKVRVTRSVARKEEREEFYDTVEEQEKVADVTGVEESSSSASDADDDQEASILEAMLSSHRNRRGADRDPTSDELESPAVVGDEKVSKDAPSKSSFAKEPEAVPARNEENEEEGEEESEVVNLMEELRTDDAPQEKTAERKSTKKKSRRKEKGKKPMVEPKDVKKPGKSKAAALSSSTCEVCGKDFDSRNLLFKHVESTNHFILKRK